MVDRQLVRYLECHLLCIGNALHCVVVSDIWREHIAISEDYFEGKHGYSRAGTYE